jgi:hypothetical protein
MRNQLLLVTLFATVACAGVTGEDIWLDGSGGGEDSVADTAQTDLRVEEVLLDNMSIETTDDLLWDEFPGETDDISNICSGGGCFLDPCVDGSDCQSGLCVLHMGNKVCTQACVEECPGGWQCEQISAGGPDSVWACVSPFTHLCHPCIDNADCESATGEKDVCVDYGKVGRFCGASCSVTDCPAGYTCAEATTVEGAVLKQCVNDAGVCSCSALAVELGVVTTCYSSNDAGFCEGQRTCTEDGLSPCDALVPTTEICNGVDDDCDGSTDADVCDDDNSCTEDSCDPEAGCQFEPLTGVSCDDGDVCTLADHCDAGVCAGTTINCGDNNVCTTDSCDPAGGCLYSFNNLACDDGDPCTVGDHCTQGNCDGEPVSCECKVDSDCLVLEDGDLCNGTLVCDTFKFPHQCSVEAGTVITCPEPEGPGSECLEAFCQPATGDCSEVAANEDGLCDDDDPCTLSSTCGDGECLGGVPINCADKDVCTDDSCDPSDGCVHTANVAGCDDGDPCTIQDQCDAGQCLPGPTILCGDDNPCTTDSCDPAVGCVHTMNQAVCNDNNVCTTNDLCANGACVGGDVLPCNDNNSCTNDSCNPQTGCQHTFNNQACNDDNECTLGDTCVNGACVGQEQVNCNDDNPCTDDYCQPGTGCVHKLNTAPCNDDDPCTISDTCSLGTCVGTGELNCDDDNPCTEDVCSDVAGCLHAPLDGQCNDGNLCTDNDACTQGICAGTDPVDCDDDNICTSDTCSPLSGCVHSLNEAPCNDDSLCTTKDFCQLGECQGTGILNCNDLNPCTTDSCNPLTGCEHIPNNSACDDGSACTLDEKCLNGWCIGIAISCNDDNLCTDDACDPVAGCVIANNDKPCDDNDACTTIDQCFAGGCVGSEPPDCNDGNICTNDSCDLETGCVNEFNTAECSDGDKCTTGDTCQEGECEPGNQTTCDDADVCTTDSCEPAQGCLYLAVPGCCHDETECDDEDPDTTDVCTNNECSHIVDAGLPHNSQVVQYTHTGGSGGCGDFSIWYTKDFGSMTWVECEQKANLHGAQFIGAPDIYNYNAPYKSAERWMAEKNATQAYTSTGGWSVANTREKTQNYKCVLGYANGTSPGNSTFNTTKVVNGKNYHYNDYGNTSEKTCYDYCRSHGARPLNPQMFGASGTAHMIENHSCHGSLQFNGGGYAADGGAPHNYKCFIGYYSE